MLRFKTISREKECRELWDLFSPNKILWDLWDFRHCFHNANFEFNFVLCLADGKEAGLLPLVYDREDGNYTYFGADFPEQNRFFLHDKSLLPKLMEQCPDNTKMYYIDEEEAKYCTLKVGDKRYFLKLEKYGSSFEKYVGSFTKKHKKNLRYDLKKLQEKGYEPVRGKTEDFDRFVELNKQRFGGESTYNDREFVASMKALIDSAEEKGILDVIRIEAGSRAEAIGLGVFYNKRYYVLGVARNVEIKNLGKFLIAEQIKSAIAHDCNEIDFLSTESKWKELWNMESEQMYEFHNQ